MANIVDPDQILHSAAFDLGLHCLLRPVFPNRVIMAYIGGVWLEMLILVI